MIKKVSVLRMGEYEVIIRVLKEMLNIDFEALKSLTIQMAPEVKANKMVEKLRSHAESCHKGIYKRLLNMGLFNEITSEDYSQILKGVCEIA